MGAVRAGYGQLTSRDKVLRAVSRQGPAPFPKHLRPSLELSEVLRRISGAEDLESHFGVDMRWVYCPRTQDFPYDRELSQEEFSRFFDFDQAARQVEQVQAAGLAAASGYEMGTFEQAHDMRGMEGLFISLLTDPKEATSFLARIGRNKARIAAGYALAGVDLVFIGDDMGSQRGLLMSEQMWSEYFRPPLEMIIQEVRSAVSGARIAYHSCGHIEPLISGLIEAGIDVLESLQPECNDVPRIIRAYHDRLSFWGGVGAQSTMARGTPEQVRSAVLELARLLPPQSGLILAPAHTLERDTPPENVLAFVEAVAEADRLAAAAGSATYRVS